MKICKVEGCNRKMLARGLCSKHYQRLVTHGDVNVLTRVPIGSSLSFRLEFYSKPEGECIIWTGTKSRGYGKLMYNGKERLAHRLSYEVNRGPIPEGMQVLHKCDNPSCINPDHLFIGTIQDNMDDRNAKGRCNPAKGESSNLSKLSNQDVVEIKKLSKEGSSLRGLASRFNVTMQNVWMIARNKTWKHISCP